MDLSEYEIEGIKEYERIFKILDEIKFHQWEIKRHFRDGKLFISTHPSDDLKIEYQWPVEVDMTQEEVFNLDDLQSSWVSTEVELYTDDSWPENPTYLSSIVPEEAGDYMALNIINLFFIL